MKFSLLLSSVAFLVAVVSAQDPNQSDPSKPIVSITSPLSGTKIKAGTDVILSWVNPTVGAISQIVLAKGPSTALQPVTTIATNVDTASGKYTWKVPYELENDSFELGTSPAMAYAGPVIIEGGVGGTLPPSNVSAPVTPPAGASSAAAPLPSSGTATASHAVPPAAGASNAKAPAAGSSPTGSGAIQLTSNGMLLGTVAGAAIIVSQFF